MLIRNDPAIRIKELFMQTGLSYSLSSFLSTLALVVIVLPLSWLLNMIAKAIILKIVTRIVKKTSSTWDDIFLEQKVFTRLSHLAPVLVNGSFLHRYPLIAENQTVLLKHRPSEATGLPFQVNAFIKINQITPYEIVQSEIFEHILAILNDLGLKIFQQPTRDDVLALSIIKNTI